MGQLSNPDCKHNHASLLLCKFGVHGTVDTHIHTTHTHKTHTAHSYSCEQKRNRIQERTYVGWTLKTGCAESTTRKARELAQGKQS